jgi:hypothetical protein
MTHGNSILVHINNEVSFELGLHVDDFDMEIGVLVGSLCMGGWL